MKLVNCTEIYWEFVRNLRMDPRVINGFIEKSKITKQMQVEYMKKYSDCYRIAIMETSNGDAIIQHPVGFVGVIDNDIRVCTHPDFQGKGVGKFMINSAMEIWPNAISKVKINNKASLRLFESCGFTKKYYYLTKDSNG